MQGDFFINDWLIQPQINAIEKGNRNWHLEPKVMQVLVHLALHPNEVLSKDKLIETIWRDTFVGDDVLIRCISEIRYVFGDDPRSPFIIQTIPKAGYRLIAAVKMKIDTATELSVAEDQAARPNRNPLLERETQPNKQDPAVLGEYEESSVSTNWQTVKGEDPTFATNYEETRNESLPSVAGVTSPKTSKSPEIESALPFYRRLSWLVPMAMTLIVIVGAAIYFWKSTRPSPLAFSGPPSWRLTSRFYSVLLIRTNTPSLQ